VFLDDLASAFQFTIATNPSAHSRSYKGKTILLTPDQPLVDS
jgi:hypothetical protein